LSDLTLNGVPVYIKPSIGTPGTVHARRLGEAMEYIMVDSLETFRALESAAFFGKPEPHVR
jgi:hypothetical protein